MATTSERTAADERVDVNETDGRRLRRSRNRDAAVDALLQLYREGRLDPSAAEIAERAGLSPRSLFRYFDDVDDLVRAAIERQTQIVFPALERRVDSDLDTPERIEQFVDLRLALFDTVGKVGRVTRLHAPFHDEIRSNLAVMRTYLRRQIELTFAAELTRLDAARRRSTIAALDVVCSYESVDLLVDDQGLSLQQTRAALIRGVSALLRAE
jgi:AcrR family transcriptional regulator